MFFTTTIWNESLYLAWSKVVEVLVPRASLIKRYLKTLSDTLDAKELIVFEKKSFLSIVSYSNMPDYENNQMENEFILNFDDEDSNLGVSADRSQKISSIIMGNLILQFKMKILDLSH